MYGIVLLIKTSQKELVTYESQCSKLPSTSFLAIKVIKKNFGGFNVQTSIWKVIRANHRKTRSLFFF